MIGPGESTNRERGSRFSRRWVLRTAVGVGGASLGIHGSTSRVRAAAGDEVWRFNTGDGLFAGFSSSPVVGGETIYIGSDDNSLYAVERATGSERWRFETEGGVHSSPVVVDGTVYVGSGDNSLYAVDTASGEAEWTFETDDSVESSPVVVDGTVYVGSRDNTLYAVEAASGEEEWVFETGDDIWSSPTRVGETVYVGSNDNNLYAVEAATGTEEWAFETGDWVRSSPTVADGTVFVGSRDGFVYAVDAASGDQEWAFETDNWVRSSPTVADSTVFVGSHDGNLYAIDATSGDQQWAFETGDWVRSAPTVADETVFVGSKDATLYAVDAATGEEAWRFETDEWIRSSPIVAGGMLYVGSDNNTLYALDASIEGSSVGSRAMLGTLGHHDGWAYADQTVGGDLPTGLLVGGSLGLATLAGGYAWISRSTGESGGRADESTEGADATTKPDSGSGTTHDSADPRIPSPESVASPQRRSLSPEVLSVVETIGTGGQAVIRKARLADGSPEFVALREPAEADTLTTEAVEEFVSMAETWETIDRREREKQRWEGSEHIVGVVDTGDRMPWVAMEYMDGGDLGDRIEDCPDGLPVEEALWIGECICRGLEVAHHLGRAHLDVKPENVLLRETDGWAWPKLADWGLARTLADETGTIDALSVAYAAPEQFDAGEFGDPDQLTDIYQAGAVVYALLTGQPPVTGSQLEVMRTVLGEEPLAPPSSRRLALSPAVDAAVGLALEGQKGDRYDSITDFKKALQAIRTDGWVPREVTSRIEQ